MKRMVLSFLFCIPGCNADEGSEENVENDSETESQGSCLAGELEHTSSNGGVFCCDADETIFCDVNSEGYTGGCWPANVDCDTITLCGDRWGACPPESLPYCPDTGDLTCKPCPAGAAQHETRSGVPVCCDDTRPLFCDENDAGYPGGCWPAVTDCASITFCGDDWGACPVGEQPHCIGDQLMCQ